METPGMILKREREAKGLTLRELAKVTRIPDASLLAIENNDFEIFPAEVFVRGFLRNYARELEISSHDIMSSYDHLKAQKGHHFVNQHVASRDVDVVPLVIAREDDRLAAANTDEEMTKHGSFRFAYLVVALIAVASIGLSLIFTGVGEAEESDGAFLEATDEGTESPFIISNTSEGWLGQ